MQIQHKGFTWIQSTCTVKTKSAYISLKQTVTPNKGPVCLKIDTERELQYTPDLGWNWHKSWNVPNISIKLTLQNEECVQWINCQVHLMAVKILQPDVYEEVGLEGITQHELIDGKAFFSGVKFNSTTYNHQGHRFQLLLILKEDDNIIVAFQSPPIFVDSRKSARDEHRQIQYIQPFEPKYLERSFCKKEKHFNDIIDAPIENNENGLHNYLTAPNIRNKIKHPLFMALKFSKCLNIYYQLNLQTDNYLIEFQKQLMQKIQQSQYIIVFQSNNNRIRKKIEESLNQLFGQSKIAVLDKKYLDESLYKKLEFTQEEYQFVYEELNKLMNQFQNDLQIEQQQKIQKDIIEPEPQIIELEKSQPFQQNLSHQERKSAFKKYKDFDKLPTKNFDEEKIELKQRQEKINNIRELENYDVQKKLVKQEEIQIQQQLNQNYQYPYINTINPFVNQINSNYSLLMQQKLQEQILQYYILQQQLMLLQMPPSV